MSVKITYFVHSSTTDNDENISSGMKDVDLSDLGKKQARDMSVLLRNKKFDAVFCSDLKRAVDSSNIFFGNKVSVIQDKRLRECDYGDYNGKTSDVVEPLQKVNITKRFPNGESYEDIKARLQSFLYFLKENYQGKHIAIVAHKAPQLALDVLLMGKTWKQAFAEDWRKKKAWQPGWEYLLK